MTWLSRSNRREFHPRPGHRRGGLAVHPEPAEPGVRQSAAAQAAAGRDVQPQRRRPVGVLARRGRADRSSSRKA